MLVADDSPSQTIFCVEKCDKKSSVSVVDEAAKPALIYELLGGSPSDLLLPRNFLIVEGKSDQIFLDLVIRRFYAEKPRIQIVFSEGDFEKQRESMNAIGTVFAPLSRTSMFRDCLVILCDTPHPQKQVDFNTFMVAYPYLQIQNQIHLLPVQSLEEYYPGHYTQTAEQVVELGKKTGLKREMARHVGKNIAKDEFETGMPVVLAALNKCWESAYQ